MSKSLNSWLLIHREIIGLYSSLLTFLGVVIAIIALFFAASDLKSSSQNIYTSILSSDISAVSNMLMNEKYFDAAVRLVPNLSKKIDSLKTYSGGFIDLFTTTLEGKTINDINLSGLILQSPFSNIIRQVNIKSCRLNNCKFNNIKIILNSWMHCVLDNATFINVDILNSKLEQIDAENLDMSDQLMNQCTLRNWDIKKSKFNKRTFINNNITDSTFKNSDFLACEFIDCNLKSDFINCDFKGSSFYKCKFNNSILQKSNFHSCLFKECDFTGADLSYTVFDIDKITDYCIFDKAIVDDNDSKQNEYFIGHGARKIKG